MNTDVEDLLRQGMERFTKDLRAPGNLTRRAARRRRRRLALRSVAGGAAALTATAVALVAAGVPGSAGNGTMGPAAPAAYVVKRIDSALSAAEPGAIAQMTVTTRGPLGLGLQSLKNEYAEGSGKPKAAGHAVPISRTATTTTEEWSYGHQWRSVTYSPAGHPVYDEGVSTSSVYTLVSYLTRKWARQVVVDRPAAGVSGRHSCGPLIIGGPFLLRFELTNIGLSAGSPLATVARALRAAISCRTLVVSGRQRVNGVEAIELASRHTGPVAETIWVSPGTYLPVRVVVRSPGGPAFRQTADITWLQPTAQNLAKFTVPIPAGFRQVSLAKALRLDFQQSPGGLKPGSPVFLLPKSPAWPLPNVSCHLSQADLTCQHGPGAAGPRPKAKG
jgi:hypothetical protein